MKTNRKQLHTFFLIMIILGLILYGCAPEPTVIPTKNAAATATVTPIAVPLPEITLKPGDNYFSVDGKTSFIFSRNIAGYQQVHYQTFLEWTKVGGSIVARIQLDSMGMGYTKTGAVDETWAAQWDRIFDIAQADGIYILPVFSGWFDWNAGTGYSTWKSNPLNEANGGPVKSPAELFQIGSATQTMWMQWMQTLVNRWQRRENILAWEIFSEVNLATGSTESSGIDFVNTAAALIRTADPIRPVTASMADVGNWPNFYRKTDIDFINVHPYPPSAQLDRYIVNEVRNYLASYNKPVLIGESGLNADTPDNYPPKAQIGVRHAIWAAVVSGAMNGRALYWEDSFGIYFSNLGSTWMQKYEMEELPAVHFVNGIDFSSFKPLTSSSSSSVWGAAVGNDKMVLGWYRDANSEPPNWDMKSILSNQTVTITVPGTSTNWQVDFYDTKTGTIIVSSAIFTRKGSGVTVILPDFTDDIAFKMTAQSGPISMSLSATTGAIAGKWSGTISGSTGTFSTLVNLEIQADCQTTKVCGTYSTPNLPCSGELFLKEVTGETFVFIEQDSTGSASCISGGYEYLQPLADGTLSFRFLFTPDSTDSTNGILQRP